jgi:glycolate oxidase iron-sulfur subunit
MLSEYPLLVEGAEAFSLKVLDLASFLGTTSIADHFTERVELRVGYDDPCHLIHAQGVSQPPRDLIQSIPGLEYVEVDGADQCCGSAGVYSLTERELSMEILDRKMEQIRAADLDVLVTGNPGCLFQFQYGARRHGMKLEVVHLAGLLTRSLADRRTSTV